MKQKKIPQRTCNGCGAQKPKKELVRVVRSPEGEVSLDLIEAVYAEMEETLQNDGQ